MCTVREARATIAAACILVLVCTALASTTAAQPYPPDSLITFKENGGWCWFQDERVIVDNHTIILGSVAGTTRAGHEGGDVHVSVYDLKTGRSETTELHNQLTRDDHAAPALLQRSDNRYLAMYTGHNDSFLSRYRISRTPHTATSWEPEQTFNWNQRTPGGSSSEVTYSNLLYLSAENRIYNFSRGDNRSPNIMISEDTGQTWTYGGKLFYSENRVGHTNGYVKYASDGTDRIHFVTTEHHPSDFPNGIYHGYIQEGASHSSGGTVIDDNIFDEDAPSPDAFTKVFHGDPHNVAWTTDVHLDARGRPVTGFSVQKDGATFRNAGNEGPGWDHRYYYAHFDGKRWNVHEMGYAGSGLYPREADYTGLLAIDPNNTNVVYVSSDVHPSTGLPSVSERDGERHYEIFRGTTNDGGASWTWTAITKNSEVDNLRPVIPDWPGPRRAVLWQRGDFRTFTDYDMNIVGIVERRK